MDPVWIPTRDGCRLAARIWLPVDAETDPVPAILEYIPYRRRDFTAQRDALMHPYVAAARVTYGVQNLTHRGGHERPEPLVPGRRYRVRVALNDVAQAFPPGHRIGLALSTAYWPIVWPSPAPVTLTVFAGASVLDLPVRSPGSADAAPAPLPPVDAPPGLAITVMEPAKMARTIAHDIGDGRVTVEVLRDTGVCRVDGIDLTMQTAATQRYSIRPDDPGSARAEGSVTVRLRRGGWRVETRTGTSLTSTAESLPISATLDAFEGDARVFGRSWDRSIPRDLV